MLSETWRCLRGGLLRGMLFSLGVCCLAQTVLSGEVDVMSFNIRFDKGTDGTNDWDYSPNPRKEKVYTTISNYDPDILGVQEAFDGQVAELSAEFPNFFYVGESGLARPGEYAGRARWFVLSQQPLRFARRRNFLV